MNKRWLLAAGVLVVAALAFGGYRLLAGRDASAEDAPETAVVSRGSLEAVIGGTGALAPVTEAALAFGVGGTVVDVPVALSQQVEEGVTLAALDTRDLTLALTAAETKLAAAQSSLAVEESAVGDLLDGPDERELELARLDLEEAKNRLWGVQAQRDSTCGRVEAGRGDTASCDQANASVLQSQAGVRRAELDYEALLAGPTAEQLAAARDRVAQAESQVASAQLQLEQARADLEGATLTAPFAGTVTAIDITAGQSVGAAQTALTLSDLSTLEVEILLDETDIADVRAGQAAQITVDAFPGAALTGSVTAIAPVGETQSGVVLFPVTVSVERSDAPVRPGMTADVEIVTLSVVDTLIVPLRALMTTPRGSFVARRLPEAAARDAPGAARFSGAPASGGAAARWRPMLAPGFELVPVTVGATTPTEAQVIDGLSAGDEVMLTQSASSGESRYFAGRSPFGMRGMLRGRP